MRGNDIKKKSKPYWNKLTWQKKCQENVLQFMFLCIIRTPLLEVKSAGKKCGLYTGKDDTVATHEYEENTYKQYFHLIFYIW